VYIYVSLSLCFSLCRAHARMDGPRTQYQHACIGGLWEHAADFPNSKHQEAFAIKTYRGSLFFIFYYYCGSFFFWLPSPARHSKQSTLGSAHLLYSKTLSRVTLYGKCTRALTFQKSQPQPVLDFTSWLGSFGAVAKAPGNNFVPCKEYFAAASSSFGAVAKAPCLDLF
jgi:hypothetical protein